MLVTYRHETKTLSFDFDVEAHVKSHHLAVEEVMREVSTRMNRPLGAVKIGGYWIIGDTTPVQISTTLSGTPVYKNWTPIWGHVAGQQARKFTKALANALGVNISSFIPFK